MPEPTTWMCESSRVAIRISETVADRQRNDVHVRATGNKVYLRFGRQCEMMWKLKLIASTQAKHRFVGIALFPVFDARRSEQSPPTARKHADRKRQDPVSLLIVTKRLELKSYAKPQVLTKLPDVLDAENISALMVTVGLFLFGVADDETYVIVWQVLFAILGSDSDRYPRRDKQREQVFGAFALHGA